MSTCPRCANQFTCAMADQTGEPCWCVQLPTEPVLPIYPELSDSDNPSCFCPNCLEEWNRISTLSKENR